MKQITEDYVSYETAKLLKEKGFDETCSYKWGIPDVDKGYVLQKWVINNGQIRNSNLIDKAYTAPSQSLALKWLREVHKIFVEPFVAIDLNGKYHYSFRLLNSICKDILEPKDLRNDFKDSYEKAIEAALLYVLKNLI